MAFALARLREAAAADPRLSEAAERLRSCREEVQELCRDLSALAGRATEAAERVRSTRATRSTCRAGSIDRFFRRGWRSSRPTDVDHAGERIAKTLSVSSREADVVSARVPPVGRSCVIPRAAA